MIGNHSYKLSLLSFQHSGSVLYDLPGLLQITALLDISCEAKIVLPADRQPSST